MLISNLRGEEAALIYSNSNNYIYIKNFTLRNTTLNS